MSTAFGGLGLTVVVGGGVAAAAAAAAVVMLRDAPAPVVAAPATIEAAPEAAPQIPPVSAPPAEPVAQAPAPLPEGPILEVVRSDADGASVVAGSGPADGTIILRLDGTAVTETRADSGGDFVALFDISPSASPRILTAEAVLADGTVLAGQEAVIIAPRPVPVAPPPEVTVASVEPALPVETAAPTETAEVTPVVEAPSPDTVAEAAPPRLFRAGPEGVTPVREVDPVMASQTLGLDTITYDLQGNVQIAGLAPRDTDLQIYVDNQAVDLVRVDQDGSWRSSLPNVDTGVYTLRVDAVDASGAVTNRVETPFQRTAPEAAAAPTPEGITVVTVQPGLTLWEISEGYFGEGVQYVQIFEENRDLIRDPDMIFPGQVFNLPARD